MCLNVCAVTRVLEKISPSCAKCIANGIAKCIAKCIANDRTAIFSEIRPAVTEIRKKGIRARVQLYPTLDFCKTPS